VVSQHHEDVDASLFEAAHAIDEVEACLEVAQIAVKDITCQHHEPAVFVESECNQIVERLARCRFHPRGIFNRFARKPEKGTIEMQIRRMNKRKFSQSIASEA